MQPEHQLAPSLAPIGRTRGAVGFAEARVAFEQAEAVQQRQAARRVAEHAHDVDDCREMLRMLGLAGLAPSDSGLASDQHANRLFPDALSVFRTTEGAQR